MLAAQAATAAQARAEAQLPTALSQHPAWRYSSPMATSGTAKNKYRCMQCEMTEDRCQCERYCCLCQAQMEVRLCQDGLYYCVPCRDACDYRVAD